jgi:hypothetical protein
MSEEKEEFTKFGQNQIEAIYHLIRGLIITTLGTLWAALRSVWKDFSVAWTRRHYSEMFGIGIALLIISALTLNSIFDIFGTAERFIHRSWYQQQFMTQAEQEVHDFFKLYAQKFSEHDCGFMSKVGVDEAMYDKYGRTDNGPNYRCENFYNGIRAKYFLPYEIEPAIESDQKKRIRGKMIVTKILDNGQTFVGAQHFEIWKVNDWDLWRFNVSSQRDKSVIPLELIPAN